MNPNFKLFHSQEILPQPRRSLSLHELEDPYKQQLSPVDDVESSPTRSATFGLGRKSRLSSGSIGGEPASTSHAASTTTLSWCYQRKLLRQLLQEVLRFRHKGIWVAVGQFVKAC
jgi:hypothetical protein